MRWFALSRLTVKSASDAIKFKRGLKIMKKFLIFLMLFSVCAVAGCGKKSGLEGTVVDGKGKPMAGVKQRLG